MRLQIEVDIECTNVDLTEQNCYDRLRNLLVLWNYNKDEQYSIGTLRVEIAED